MFLKIISFFMPWFMRRRVLNAWFGFEIDRTAKIGMAWVFPQKLIMKSGSRIDHFSVAINLQLINMDENSSIGRSNWITGYPLNNDSKHFKHQPQRKPELYIGKSSSVTKKHHLDCTNTITIGQFSTIAGYDSQLLTHSINLLECRQDSAPINIGDYTFVGTNVTILGGASLPSFSVLGAKSLLNKVFYEAFTLYGGVPAKPLQPISKDAKYFMRADGFVY